MKKILLIALFISAIAQSQEKTFEKEVKKISDTITKITQQQKDSLKEKVKEINAALNNNKITLNQADALKKQAATYHATQIEKQVTIQEQKLQELVQQKVDGKIKSSDNFETNIFTIGDKKYKLGVSNTNKKTKKRKKSKRTTSQIVFAMGLNNVLSNNKFESLNNSDYKFWQSHFYEVGFTYKTRLLKKPSKTYFKYGISFLWNNIRPDNNYYHTINGNQTSLTKHAETLTESRLRNVQMTFPMHIEFDFSKNKRYSDGEIVDRTNKSIRFAIGGFFGFKLGTRQYLEYKNSQDIAIKEVQKNSFNTNTVNYGLSALFAYKGFGFYTKYDLNPLFKNTDIRNISMGIRFDLN
ncbi:hypothetical protein [Tenacibaculum sp. UWU-22]|uniref:hypothetical protein n=1 Tax=Tenacibaculum sp. UWU-22 TaxID=3234187 RepID=UPI0034DB1C30